MTDPSNYPSPGLGLQDAGDLKTPLPLPYELQSLILAELSFSAVLALRATSRAFYKVVLVHQEDLCRRLWPRVPPAAVQCRCEVPPGSWRASSGQAGSAQADPTLVDLFVQRRRAVVEHKLGTTLADLVYSKFLRISIRPGVPRLDAMRLRLIARLRFALRHLQEYLIDYRSALLARASCSEDSESTGTGVSERNVSEHSRHFTSLSRASGSTAKQRISHARQSTVSPEPDYRLQLSLLRQLASPCLADVHATANLLRTALSMKLRPPSYATVMERVVRRWTKDGASDGMMSALIMIGGLEAVEWILSLRPYVTRIEGLRALTESIEDENWESSESYTWEPFQDFKAERRRSTTSLVLGRRQSKASTTSTSSKGSKEGLKLGKVPSDSADIRPSVFSTRRVKIDNVWRAAMPILSVSQRAQVLAQIEDPDDIFFKPTGKALDERSHEGALREMNVTEALDWLVRRREGDEEVDFWDELLEER